jgi:hypothetical protein
VRFSLALLFSAARCSSARANCALADFRFMEAVGSAVVELGVEATKGGAGIRKDPARRHAAKTGETLAKALRKKSPGPWLRRTSTEDCEKAQFCL